MSDKDKPDSDGSPAPEQKATSNGPGASDPRPVQYIRPPSILARDSQPPQVITKIIKEPSLSTNLGIVVRDWFKSRAISFWGNLRADVGFCRKAFEATFAQGWWSKLIAVLTHSNKWLNRFTSVGILAFIISLYVKYVYPNVGKAGTAIVALSLVVSSLLVTIRVTRRLYEKALLQARTGDRQSPNSTSDDDVSYKRNLIETWRDMIVLAERKYTGGKEPAGISFSEIFQRQPAFIKLVPLLSKEAIDALDADVREELTRTERKRPVVLRALLAKEISRIETELELFPRLAAPAALHPQTDRKLLFEINKANTNVRVDQNPLALRIWLDIELRFENKDTYPVAFKHFDVSMDRYGIKNQRPRSDVNIRFAFLRITTSDGAPIEINGFEGMMIQERRLTPFYRIHIMIAVEDDQIQRAEDLDILDTLHLAMHSSGDNSQLVANLHPNWEVARERENGTHLISITGVPTIEMDYRRLR